jgi:hypothetical protein
LIGHNLVHQQLRRPEVLAELTGWTKNLLQPDPSLNHHALNKNFH